MPLDPEQQAVFREQKVYKNKTAYVLDWDAMGELDQWWVRSTTSMSFSENNYINDSFFMHNASRFLSNDMLLEQTLISDDSMHTDLNRNKQYKPWTI